VLGAMPLPVEVVPFAMPWVADRIRALGASPVRRESDGQPVETDQHNWLLDCHFGSIPDPAALTRELERVPGILEHGLFLGLAKLAVVADGDRVALLRPGLPAGNALHFPSLPPVR
jgi:ribose 5-phosphate isomerase A